MLMLVARLRLRLSMLAAVSIAGLASFVLNVALIGSNPVATFYLPFTRAWELLAGAALACSWNQLSHSRTVSNLRAFVGILLIATAAGVLDTKSAFPGWWAVLPVGGAALLLSAPAAWFCRSLLASPPLVWIGLISYPLYLWHWPLLVFFGIIKFAPLTLEIRDMANVPTQSAKWRFHECLLDLSHETSFADSCVDRNRRPLILIWGDSTAGALVPGLRKAQESRA